MNRILRVFAVLLLATLFGACSTTSTPPPVDEPVATDTSGVRTAADIERDELARSERMRREQLLSETRVYFEFDSSAIDESSRAIVEAHAAELMKNSSRSMTLEGHCDERGTREYNLALGERRAIAVYRLMVAFGVPANQLKYMSYGEEKPLAAGHDESAWRQNRRVELIY